LPPWEDWRTAFDSLRSNKLRVLLAVFGVTVGSASIILVVAVNLTARVYVLEQIEAIGSNVVMANYEYDPQYPLATNQQIRLEDLAAVLAGTPEVNEVAGTRQMPMILNVDDAQVPVNLVGVTERFQAIRKLLITRGRYFEEDDLLAHSRVCLITPELAKRIAPGDNPIGRSLRFGELQFDVIGVFTERVSSFGAGEIQRESVLVPFEQMTPLTGDDVVWLLYAQARSTEDVGPATKSIAALLTSRHPGKGVYHVRNLSSIVDLANHIALIMRAVMLIIAFIAMLSSGVGIMNIMLTSVAERTQEIGIRRAFGARRNQILFQFLLEALAISLAGALSGIVLGLLVPIVLQPLLRNTMRVEISWLSPLWALMISCAFGVTFGLLPANRAARLDPAECLRYN
jgi:putative ABC transport system permease protein